METVVTNKCAVSREKFDEIVSGKMSYEIAEFVKRIEGFVNEVTTICNGKTTVALKNEPLFFDATLKLLMPDLRKVQLDEIGKLSDMMDLREYFSKKKFLGNLETELPTLQQLRARARLLTDIYGEEALFACVCDDIAYSRHYKREVAYNPFSDTPIPMKENDIKIIPIVNLKYATIKQFIIKYLLPYGVCLDGVSVVGGQCFEDMCVLSKAMGKVFTLSPEGRIDFCGGSALIERYLNNPDDDLFKKLHWRLADVLRDYYETKCAGPVELAVKEDLLNCEKIRADIDPYEERILTDPNRGHWDLWIDQNDSVYTVEMEENMVARNPLCDINENGVIAIDFGTKSTIVVYQSDIEHSLPMGIGDGNLSKEPSVKRYENPTVMHFVDLDRFLQAYKAKAGRPETRWEDLTISHTAIDQFSNSRSEEYYEYLHQIKQWAGQRERQFRIQSHNGKTHKLPPFLELDEMCGWNPIEIYAYYIGLYINNMRKGHGIFLEYYLSFPVTYETKIREKIVRSFERGLKKSLPVSILNNEEVMKRFHVNGEISEPAAYAVCALQEYGFEPEEDEEVFYGIFDFGGGTTDFDFGLWKQSRKRRYDYTIENFGAGGDEYLGGENLLEMLAFEVFKENQALMRKKGYTFTLAPKCTEFLGSDSLLADSQEAEKNMHNLMEKLRPYWELSDESEEEPEEDAEDIIEFKVNLFDKEGNDHANETLSFSKSRLEELIERRIKEGINNFFSALLLSYQNEKVKKPTTVNILLAGNSCKSPVVKKLFQEAIKEQEMQVKRKYGMEGNVGTLFEIFPPLGTEDAYKKMEERGLPISRDDFEKPTGKTGVAFGLIQCRAGGTIERIQHVGAENEIAFQYFIGWRSRKKFVVFKGDSKITKYIGKPDYNIWYKFIEADASAFDLYYTSLPECIEGELLVDGNAAVKRLRCSIDVVDETANVYIRAVDPHTLEYVVAQNDDVEKSKLGKIIRKEL